MFWAQNTTDSFSSMIVPIFMLLRRLMIIAIVIYMGNYPIFQVIPILWTTFFNLCYMLWTRRYYENYHYYQELINEGVVYIIMVAFLLFTNIAIPNVRRDEIAWLVVLLLSLNIA
tara:strand:- start:828 stop:1172 length:345 start_codon:yes stop_codon:yes gene_type:complete